MATRIQSHWRGYASRIYVHDFSKRRRYLQKILRINEATRDVLKQAEKESLIEQMEIAAIAKKNSIHTQLSNMHHLLSTASIRGTLVNTPTRSLDIALNGDSLESAVEDYFRRYRPRPSEKQQAILFGAEETIRVAGPYDHLREDRQLAGRVEAQFMAMRGSKPFIPSCRSAKAWKALPTFAQTQASHSVNNTIRDARQI